MGSGSEGYSKKHSQQQAQTKYKLKMLVLVTLTHLLTVYVFTNPSFNLKLSGYTNHIPFRIWDSTDLLHELNSTRDQLAASHLLIAELHQKLNSTNLLVQALLIVLNSHHEALTEKKVSQPLMKFSDRFGNAVFDELMLAVGPHKLPLGYSPRMGSGEVYTSMGAGCLKYQEELSQYMKYEIGGECPTGVCEPLPRWRCLPKSPANYKEPTPLPESLWATPSDTSYLGCTDCFDLQGREKTRWMFDNGGLHYGIDQVLKAKRYGTICIGLDISGRTGTFAARMKERNVTLITSSMNLDGLIPIHVCVSQRLPFFENTLDIVHFMHVLSNWIPDAMLEFTLYDIYRVLRRGVLFRLDHFFRLGSQLNQTYISMLDRVGFKKLRWNAGMKLD
ncbi:hypothetical protein P3X46_031818 [Hevea brasiliensis]|uniref:Methyltransferase type 11 domain-containing protein n=1 Tax=Hevea brasiliensis TaxID=3981 RepID=A0ABQ9KMU8_HEVBR|nr:hypothetical protein P3X46_031818 [Hevea brasiliensis]